MNKKQLEEFKEILLKEKTKIMNGGILTAAEDLHVSADDLADEGDLANTVINQQVTFSLRNREMIKLRSIEEALMRINDGTYGQCDDCGEPIGEKRLASQPWATLCIEHAEEHERATGLNKIAV
ncbi:MAG: TraR/DksA family transcriptional regulator [Bacteriovoracaceae bacterium]|nr:TraR/DksA family transcriptional regulator [Bacteriovoracaceae bacterium]